MPVEPRRRSGAPRRADVAARGVVIVVLGEPFTGRPALLHLHLVEAGLPVEENADATGRLAQPSAMRAHVEKEIGRSQYILDTGAGEAMVTPVSVDETPLILQSEPGEEAIHGRGAIGAVVAHDVPDGVVAGV